MELRFDGDFDEIISDMVEYLVKAHRLKLVPAPGPFINAGSMVADDPEKVRQEMYRQGYQQALRDQSGANVACADVEDKCEEYAKTQRPGPLDYVQVNHGSQMLNIPVPEDPSAVARQEALAAALHAERKKW